MNLGLRNRVAIVTGGSKGIGRVISTSLAQEGVKVAIIARNKDAINRTCREITDQKGTVLGISADVTSQEDVNRAIENTVKVFGGLDILVNNAGGVSKYGGFRDLNNKDWIDSFNLNVMSWVNFSNLSEKYLLKSAAGRVITISSITGLQPGFFNPHYSFAKAATINLSKQLANVYAKHGICVNSISAGPVHSDSWMQNVASQAAREGISFDQAYQDMENTERTKIPLGRVGEGEDIANMVLFLASDRAQWITGSCLQVSGGKYACIS